MHIHAMYLAIGYGYGVSIGSLVIEKCKKMRMIS